MTSPHPEATDLPPGPDTDASVASPALAEQKAVVKETDLPKDTPTETEDPDRVVTRDDSKKPKEDEPEKSAVQTSASVDSVAPKPPLRRVRARKGRRSVAPSRAPAKARAASRDLAERTGRASRPAQALSVGAQQKTAEIRSASRSTARARACPPASSRVSGDNGFRSTRRIAMVCRSDPMPPPAGRQWGEGGCRGGCGILGGGRGGADRGRSQTQTSSTRPPAKVVNGQPITPSASVKQSKTDAEAKEGLMRQHAWPKRTGVEVRVPLVRNQRR